MRMHFIVVVFLVVFALPSMAWAQSDSSSPPVTTTACANAFSDAINNGTPLPHCSPEANVASPAGWTNLVISSDLARAACAIALSGAISVGPPFPKCPPESYVPPSAAYPSFLSNMATAECAEALGNAITEGSSLPNCQPESSPSPSSGLSDPNTLQNLWNQQDTACQGGAGDDPATQTACNARDVYDAELRASGWCYGEPGDSGYQMSWHQCGSSEQPDNNNSETSQQQSLEQQFEATNLNVIPPPIMACLQKAYTNWAVHGTSDVDAIEDCNVPANLISNAIAFEGQRTLNGQPVDSPWTDAHCQALVNAYVCEDQGVSDKFSN